MRFRKRCGLVVVMSGSSCCGAGDEQNRGAEQRDWQGEGGVTDNDEKQDFFLSFFCLSRGLGRNEVDYSLLRERW